MSTQRGPGRPASPDPGKQIQFRVDGALLARLDAYGATIGGGVNRAIVIRALLERALREAGL